MTAILSVMVPTAITTSLFTNSTASEADYAAWTSGATFASGAFCINTTTHRVYQSQRDSNIGHDPTDLNNQFGPIVYWTDYGPTNRWAMFDSEVSTQTAITSPLTVVIHPGAFNALYIANVDAEAISITVKDSPGGNVIYSYSGTLEGSAPADYDEYFFGRFKPQTDFLASGIDQYNNAEIALTLTRASGLVRCGVLAVGDLRPLGRTQSDAKAKPKTYSYIKTDEFGNTKIVRRKATTDMTASAMLNRTDANTVLATLREVLDVPAIWIGSDIPDFGGLRCFGLGSGDISYPCPDYCFLSLSVQGMI